MTLPQSMRSWVSGAEPGLAHLALKTVDVPAPKAGEVLVEVEAAALNFSDLLMIDGQYQVRPPRPFVPGQEVAGRIAVVPEGSRWQVGQRVAAKVYWAGFAEYAIVRDHMILPLPDAIGFAQGAALPVVYTTAMVALHHTTQVRQGQSVLVHAAAGGVGLAAVEIAHAAGARVIATAGSSEKLALAESRGAAVTINYRDADWKDQVKTATAGKGADIIVDSVGGDVALQSLRCIARGGSLLIVGFASGQIAQLPSNLLLLKQASARGVIWDHELDGPMLEDISVQLIDLLNAGKINPVAHMGYGLDDLPKALGELGNRQSTGKLVLTIKRSEA